jgi:hypothetical protein
MGSMTGLLCALWASVRCAFHVTVRSSAPSVLPSHLVHVFVVLCCVVLSEMVVELLVSNELERMWEEFGAF